MCLLSSLFLSLFSHAYSLPWTRMHTPSSRVTASFTKHKLPTLLPCLMGMRLVQIIWGRGLRDSRLHSFYLSHFHQEGKACLVFSTVPPLTWPLWLCAFRSDSLCSNWGLRPACLKCSNYLQRRMMWKRMESLHYIQCTSLCSIYFPVFF